MKNYILYFSDAHMITELTLQISGKSDKVIHDIVLSLQKVILEYAKKTFKDSMIFRNERIFHEDPDNFCFSKLIISTRLFISSLHHENMRDPCQQILCSCHSVRNNFVLFQFEIKTIDLGMSFQKPKERSDSLSKVEPNALSLICSKSSFVFMSTSLKADKKKAP